MKLHPQIASLIADIDAFVASQGTTPTSFGKDALGDPNLYRHLKQGRCPRFETLDRIRAFMAREAA